MAKIAVLSAVILFCLATFNAAARAETAVDLELIVAVDVSGSMDEEEHVLQRQGFVAAFRHPEVIHTIMSGFIGRVAVIYVEWAGPVSQVVTVPWWIIDGKDSAGAFADILADYYNQHFTQCVSGGGSLSSAEAAGRAKELLEREYRRRNNGDIVTAFNDAHDGTNGGMRVVLDKLAEAIKAESVERYIREVFDRYVTPNAWEDKVEIIRQFISSCGSYLASSIRTDQPERYAQNFQELIRSYVESLQNTSSIFRRL